MISISERKLSASVSVSAENSAETETEMSVSAVFRHFGIGRHVGLIRYRNLGRDKQLFCKNTQKNIFISGLQKRKRIISSNLLTLEKN